MLKAISKEIPQIKKIGVFKNKYKNQLNIMTLMKAPAQADDEGGL